MRRRRTALLGGAFFVLTIGAFVWLSSSANANPVAGIAALSAGEQHTCAITDVGGVKCWGSDMFGQLGDGGAYGRRSTVPVDVPGLSSGIVALASGYSHTCALSDSGDLTCWGDGSAAAPSSHGVTAIGAGGRNTCVVTVSGAVTCSGSNVHGQASPGPASGAVSVALSEWHTCALMAGGGVKCWGENQFGQLGDGTATDRWSPVDVVGLTNAVAIAAGNSFTCALTDAGGVKCWGDRYGNFPADIAGLTSGVTAISSAVVHVCALLESGGVKCWGTNSFGQLGDGQRCGRTACIDPVDVAGLQSGITAIATGSYHTCAVTSQGGVKCWGNNFGGQLGNGKWGPRLISATPVDVVEQHAKPAPTPDCPQEGCATPVRPEPPRTGLDFSIAIDANGDGIDDCTTHEEHRSECTLQPGSAFTVRLDLNALPADMASYTGFDASLTYAGIESTHKSISLWTDCGYPASLHESGRVRFGCAAPIDSSSTFVGPLGESHFTCAGNGSVTLRHGETNTGLVGEDGYTNYHETQRGAETLTVTCGDLVPGDVDCNVLVNPVDAALVLQREAVLIDTLGCPQQSDVNLDNRTNAVDAAITLQYTAGLVDVLPPQAVR
jgi:alpha-tubulin suppressor-like RCC1 family protein